MDFLELCKNRYSVRKFSERAVEDEKLETILEAGRLAPTAKNSQSHRIFVLKTQSALQKIHDATPMSYNAPVVLAVCYEKSASYKNTSETVYVDSECGAYDGGEVDAAIVTTAMMFEAADLGLGTLWARGFDSAEIMKALDLPDTLHLVCLLDIGYPAEDSAPSERHFQRLPICETVKEW